MNSWPILGRMMTSLTAEQHEELAHLGSHVDGGAEEVEGGRVLLHGQVHQAQIVEDLPVKRTQVVRSLQAANGLNIET